MPDERIHAPCGQLAAPEARKVDTVEGLKVSLDGVVMVAEQSDERDQFRGGAERAERSPEDVSARDGLGAVVAGARSFE
ncbi:hypothetical protein Q0Z83_054310 [Actinoplanes sichuanensis]|nr:hypothetical protein Q0Z83_054310 [Actinoplanes sichuanensis]